MIQPDNVKLFQLCAKGSYLNFDGKNKYYSKFVYVKPPSQLEIDNFIQRCCNNTHPNNLYDIDINTVEISVLNIELINNEIPYDTKSM